MTISIGIVLGITVVALVLFLIDRIPVDVTAILVMVGLMVSGVLTPEEGLSGFSNTATVTILALLIISGALKNTGAVESIGNRMVKIAGKQQWFALLSIMTISAVASAFINNTAVVAVFIPVMFRVSKSLGVHVSLLLIPLSFASMVGGSTTMIGTSTNLLINSLATDHAMESFPLFQPVVMGGIFFVAAMLYMLFLGRHMIPKRSKRVRVFDKDIDTKEYITEVVILENSPEVGRILGESNLINNKHGELLRVIKSDGSVVDADDYEIIEAGDCLVMKADIAQIVETDLNRSVRIRTNKLEERGVGVTEQEQELFEVLIPEYSNLLGQRIKDVDFVGSYDAVPLGVKKKRLTDANRLAEHKIQFGDILLLGGTPHEREELTRDNWVPIQRFSSEAIQEELPRKDRRILSVAIVAAVVGLAVFNIIPISVSAWAGVVVLFLTGCIRVDKAYRNVEWKVIFLLAGIIPLGTAISKTGADVLIADGIVNLAHGSSLQVVVGVLFAITVLLTGIVSNQATAVLLVPVAISLAQQMSFPAEPLVMTILFGASTSFLTPVGYQTNAMILGPGDYKFVDFLRVGGLLSLIFLILAVIFIPMLYG